jgi:hypothetical protein
VSALLQEQANHVEPLAHALVRFFPSSGVGGHGQKQRGYVVFGRGVGVGTVGQEHFGDIDVALHGSEVERGFAVVARALALAPCFRRTSVIADRPAPAAS